MEDNQRTVELAEAGWGFYDPSNLLWGQST